MSSGINVVRLAEIFVRAPIFSLAFGAFAKLYEDEVCPTNYKALVWSKLTEFCITLHTSRKNVCNLLIRADVACSNRFPEILACIVCREIYFHPVVLFCGHAFCRRCLDARFNCHCCSSSSTSGELNDCLLLSKIIQSLFPDVASLHQRLDELSAMTAKGHYAEALAAVDQLLEQYPNNVRCLQTKVDACLLNSDFDTALFITDKAMEHGFLVPKWFCLKARALKGLGHRRRALEYLFKCFTVYPYSDCLRSEITLILDEVITTADVTQWKNVVQLCTADSTSVLDVISNLPEDAKTTVFIEPWMQLSLTCQTTETTLIMLHEPPFNLSDELHPTKDFITAIRDDFQCALCLLIFLYPCSLPCGHTFCRECIEQSLDYKPECPLCKTPLSNYRSASGRGISVCIWKMVQMLFPNELDERQRAYEREMETLSRVGLDPDVELPVMPCCLAYPGLPCPLHIFEPQFRGMVRRAVNSGSRRFGLFPSKSPSSNLSAVGTIVQITNYETLPDGRLLIDTKGCDRVRVLSHRVVNGLTNIRFEFYRDFPVNEEDKEIYQVLKGAVHSMASEWLATVPCQTRASLVPFFGPLPPVNSCAPEGDANGPASWVWWLVAVLPLNETCRYKLLSCRKPLERLNILKGILNFLSSGQWKPDDPSHCTGLSC